MESENNKIAREISDWFYADDLRKYPELADITSAFSQFMQKVLTNGEYFGDSMKRDHLYHMILDRLNRIDNPPTPEDK